MDITKVKLQKRVIKVQRDYYLDNRNAWNDVNVHKSLQSYNQEENSRNTTTLLRLMELVGNWAVYSACILSKTLSTLLSLSMCSMRIICFILLLGIPLLLANWVLIIHSNVKGRGWRKGLREIIFLAISIQPYLFCGLPSLNLNFPQFIYHFLLPLFLSLSP